MDDTDYVYRNAKEKNLLIALKCYTDGYPYFTKEESEAQRS